MEWAVFGGRMENSQDATADADCEDAVCIFRQLWSYTFSKQYGLLHPEF